MRTLLLTSVLLGTVASHEGGAWECHHKCGMDVECHKACPSHEGHAWQCHHKCGMDVECHKACPNPWKRFEEKCEAMNATKACHKECGYNVMCHFSSCPSPFHSNGSFWNAHTAWEAIKHVGCHFMCREDDEACHNECGNPLQQFEAMCDSFKTVKECHKKCGMDHECHYNCPHWHHHHGHGFHEHMEDWHHHHGHDFHEHMEDWHHHHGHDFHGHMENWHHHHWHDFHGRMEDWQPRLENPLDGPAKLPLEQMEDKPLEAVLV